jgi:hypothetical protein
VILSGKQSGLRNTTVGTGIILSTDSAKFGSTQGYALSVPLRQKVVKVLTIRALKLFNLRNYRNFGIFGRINCSHDG